MHKKTLFATRRLPKEVEASISRDYIARFNTEDRLYSTDELVKIAEGADALLITQENVMSANVLSRMPKSVRVIATNSARAITSISPLPRRRKFRSQTRPASSLMRRKVDGSQ